MCYTHFCEDWSELISTWKQGNDVLLPVFSVNFAFTSSLTLQFQKQTLKGLLTI